LIMSVQYEVVFACFLRDDTPAETLDALRWHLGLLSDRPPGISAADQPDRLLCPDPASGLPGGDVASLQPQAQTLDHGRQAEAWGLYSRTVWAEDALPGLAAVLELVAGNVANGGYGGYYRDVRSTNATAFDFDVPGDPPG
jgi:hypothetical protein